MKRALLALLLIAISYKPCEAQLLHSSIAVESAAGAGLNLALRGPWMEEGWRKPIPRAAIFMAMSAAYEGLIDVNGWSNKDVEQRALGYAATEVAVIGAKFVFTRIFHHRRSVHS